MLLSEFNFALPERLIAQVPLPVRRESRLLCVDRKTGRLTHGKFSDLPALLSAGDCLVLNDSKVLPARLRGRKSSGGKVEILLERELDEHSFWALLGANHRLKIGERVLVGDHVLTILTKEAELFKLSVSSEITVSQLFLSEGEVPLPPYIERSPNPEDLSRYQTIYAQDLGSSAAPTAGLHFDQAIFQNLEARKIHYDYLTLHVGLGTFQPVKTARIQDHQIHAEQVIVSNKLCQKVGEVKQAGGKIIAVGTTSLRSLETASDIQGRLQPFRGESRLFIYPGYSFKLVDGLVTNFHLPKSSLLMLVCAFAGYELAMRAYQVAIEHEYRFYSYGDAMLVL